MTTVDVLRVALVLCLGIHGLLGADVYGTEGGSVVIECDLSYDPGLTLFWETVEPGDINSQILLKKSDGTIEYLRGPWQGRVDLVNGKDLRITNVSREDDSDRASAKYRCSQPTGGGGEYRLHVRYPPSSISVTGYNSSSPLHPGDELQLSCHASNSNPAPTYAWTRNGPEIVDGRTLTINPIKLGDNGDVITCKVKLHDGNEPVYDWEGESERITLSVTDEEPGDGTTVGGSGNGVDVGLAVGLSVAAVVIIALLAVVIVRWIRNRPGPPATNGGPCQPGVAPLPTVTGGGSVATADVEGSGNDLENVGNGTLPNGDIPMGPLPAVHVENEDSGDGSPTGEFVDEHVGPPATSGNNAEPGDVNSSDYGDSQRPTSSQSDRPDLGPVQETAGPQPPAETTPLMPQSDLNQMWADILDIVEDQVRSSTYRKRLGRKLGLRETELEEIEENYHHLGAREKLRQILIKWEEKNSNESSMAIDLVAALRSMECNRVARMVEQCWESYGSP